MGVPCALGKSCGPLGSFFYLWPPAGQWVATPQQQKENRPLRAVLLRLFRAGRFINDYMTWLEAVLGVFFLVASGLAVAGQRRYLALQRKHKVLQRLYEKAEQQLNTLWTSKKP